MTPPKSQKRAADQMKQVLDAVIHGHEKVDSLSAEVSQLSKRFHGMENDIFDKIEDCIRKALASAGAGAHSEHAAVAAEVTANGEKALTKADVVAGISDIRIGLFYETLVSIDGGKNLLLTTGPGFEADEPPNLLSLMDSRVVTAIANLDHSVQENEKPVGDDSESRTESVLDQNLLCRTSSQITRFNIAGSKVSPKDADNAKNFGKAHLAKRLSTAVDGVWKKLLPELNNALGDNGLKHLREAKVLRAADLPCADVIAQARGLLNVTYATHFVWPPLGVSDSDCETDFEEKKSKSNVFGIHPLLTDPAWASTLISLATNAKKVGQENWELLVSGVDKRYAAGKTNMPFMKNVMDLVPNPFEAADAEESTPGISVRGSDNITSVAKLSIPMLAFIYVKCVNRIARVVKMAESSKSSHATPWALVCIRLSEMIDDDGKLPNGIYVHPLQPSLLGHLKSDVTLAFNTS